MEQGIYVKQGCKFEFESRTVESGCAMVTPDVAIGYMSNDMKSVTNWHGVVLSSNAVIVSKWSVRNSFMSDCMYQVKAKINGVWYTGRTAGAGMIWKGKAVKGGSR